jgi:hypothetical protein
LDRIIIVQGENNGLVMCWKFANGDVMMVRIPLKRKKK